MAIKFSNAVGVMALTVALSACTVGGYPLRTKPIPMPAEGFEAVKFLQYVTAPDHSINVYGFTAGTVLIQDREVDGAPMYCGPFTINGSPIEGCFMFEQDTMVIGYGSLLKEVRRDLTGKIEHIRVNPSEKQ